MTDYSRLDSPSRQVPLGTLGARPTQSQFEDLVKRVKHLEDSPKPAKITGDLLDAVEKLRKENKILKTENETLNNKLSELRDLLGE